MEKEKEMARKEEVPFEAFSFNHGELYELAFEGLVKYIPKVEKGGRVKVTFSNGKYFPLTKVGGELLLAYKMVGFSFIPVLVVERKEEEKREEEVPW